MLVDYQPFVERMINHYEGGYGWDAYDPGGPTKYGITCYDLAEYDNETMDSMQRWAPIVEAMPLAIADAIYADKYAVAVNFNSLHAGCDCAIFDFGVNSGTAQAIRYAQIVVNVYQDGIMGPITLAAINAYNPANFINELCNARMNFLKGLPIWTSFSTGWTARVADLRAYSLNLLAPQTKVYTYASKHIRIPLAFAKSYMIRFQND